MCRCDTQFASQFTHRDNGVVDGKKAAVGNRTIDVDCAGHLANRDGDEHSFYQQFNSIDALQYTIVAFSDKIPLGCGAIKEFDANTMEVKRMYVIPEFRGKGMASQLLLELEQWAFALGYTIQSNTKYCCFFQCHC